MKVTISGGHSFSFLKVLLSPGDNITSESGAMSSMDSHIGLATRLNGGLLKAILIKFLGRESLFINTYSNDSDQQQSLILSQKNPGQICEVDIEDEPLYIQPGSFLACTSGVNFVLKWAGFSSMLGGEGLFRLQINGKGKVWFGAYGSIVEKQVKGEYIVDSGHLLSYPNNMKLKIKLSGGIFSSIFSGEGLVLQLKGDGVIKLQTRSIRGLTGWLNPRFW